MFNQIRNIRSTRVPRTFFRSYHVSTPALFPCYTPPMPYVSPNKENVEQSTTCFTLINNFGFQGIHSKYNDQLSTMPDFTIEDDHHDKLQCDYRSVLHDILANHGDEVKRSVFHNSWIIDMVLDQLSKNEKHFKHRIKECHYALKNMISRRKSLGYQLEKIPDNKDEHSKEYHARQLILLDIEPVDKDIDELKKIIDYQTKNPHDLFTHPIFWNNFRFNERFGSYNK